MAPTFTLYTAPTPNGLKIGTYISALEEAYPGAFTYDYKSLSFQKNEQKSEEYLKVNPNGRIPAIVHHRADKDFRVFESAAIMLYLTQQFDKEYKLTFPPGSDEESEVLQWTFWGHGGVGPMQGQANHFFRYAPEKIPYGIERYQNETLRLYNVIESRLKEGEGRDYLVGPGRGKLTFADISIWAWVSKHSYAGVETDTIPLVEAWIKRIEALPAAQKGMTIPAGQPKPKTKEEEDAQIAENAKWVMASNKKQ